MIDEDLTPKQTYDKSKLEAYAKMVCLLTHPIMIEIR